jgi:uncharacterized membrane protein
VLLKIAVALVTLKCWSVVVVVLLHLLGLHLRPLVEQPQQE